jgi:hypothetical protein
MFLKHSSQDLGVSCKKERELYTVTVQELVSPAMGGGGGVYTYVSIWLRTYKY